MTLQKSVTLLVISGACAFLFACHDNENENEVTSQPEPILSLQVDADFDLVGDTWIFASDENGEILDVKPYAQGKTVTLSSTRTLDKFNVTFFNYAEQSNGTIIAFDTWMAVKKGTALRYQMQNPTLPIGPTKHATFKISNYTGLTPSALAVGPYTDVTGTDLVQNNLEMDLALFGTTGKITVTGYRAGIPVYNRAEGVEEGSIIERDYETDFLPFPHQYKLDFEGFNNAYIVGLDPANTRQTLLNTEWLINPSGHPVIGYIDGFNVYDTQVVNSQVNGQGIIIHHTLGGPPDFSFSMPTFTFSLSKNDMNNFSFNFSEDYTYLSIRWLKETPTVSTYWTVYAPPGQPITGLIIPTEIKTKYPQIDPAQLTYRATHFTRIVEGPTYLEKVPGMPRQSGALEEYLYSPY
jgi:hypothetical protein